MFVFCSTQSLKLTQARNQITFSILRMENAGKTAPARSSLMRADHSLTRRDPRIDRLRSRPPSTRDADHRYCIQIPNQGAAGNDTADRPASPRSGRHRPKEHVEVDETWVGGRTRGEGRGIHHKTPVAAAVEVRH